MRPARSTLALLALVVALGCGSSGNGTTDASSGDAGQDAIVGDDAGTDAALAADTGPTTCAADYAGCATLEDHTADTTVTVNVTGPPYAYAPKCIRIHVGTTVNLPGSALHPLRRSSCSPADSPLPAASTTGGAFTFTVPGSYGYWCENHGADEGTGMAGLIVVE